METCKSADLIRYSKDGHAVWENKAIQRLYDILISTKVAEGRIILINKVLRAHGLEPARLLEIPESIRQKYLEKARQKASANQNQGALVRAEDGDFSVPLDGEALNPPVFSTKEVADSTLISLAEGEEKKSSEGRGGQVIDGNPFPAELEKIMDKNSLVRDGVIELWNSQRDAEVQKEVSICCMLKHE